MRLLRERRTPRPVLGKSQDIGTKKKKNPRDDDRIAKLSEVQSITRHWVAFASGRTPIRTTLHRTSERQRLPCLYPVVNLLADYTRLIHSVAHRWNERSRT